MPPPGAHEAETAWLAVPDNVPVNEPVNEPVNIPIPDPLTYEAVYELDAQDEEIDCDTIPLPPALRAKDAVIA